MFRHWFWQKVTTREGFFSSFPCWQNVKKEGLKIYFNSSCWYYQLFASMLIGVYSNNIFCVALFSLITSPIILNGGYHMLAPTILPPFCLIQQIQRKHLWSGEKIDVFSGEGKPKWRYNRLPSKIDPCYASTPSFLWRLVPGGILDMILDDISCKWQLRWKWDAMVDDVVYDWLK